MFESATRGDMIACDEVGAKGDLPCPVCGGGSYSWGTVGAQGLNYTPDNASILAKFFRVGLKVRARRCELCGNIQMFARTPEAGAAAESSAEEDASSTIVFAGSSAEAEVVRSFLESNGIATRLVDEHIGTVAPHLAAAGGAGAFKVVVEAGDAARAEGLLAEHDRRP